jgi:hypothetical protein
MLNRRSHTSAEVDLRSIAKRAMLDREFLIQVPEEAQSQLKIEKEPAFETLKLPDLTSWLWSSIDNDDSRASCVRLTLTEASLIFNFYERASDRAIHQHR